MKISKLLLQAILVAVTVNTITSSCTKEKQPPLESTTNNKKAPSGCPACGMG